MLTALYTIIVFSVIIAIHELGHFVVAKMSGITVHEFAIGMGPKLISRVFKDTEYSIRLLPVCGFVKLEGEDEESDDINAFCNKKPWKRFLVLFAGAFMNFILGFILFVILFSLSGGIATNYVKTIIPDSPFHDAGIQENDRIIFMQTDTDDSKISNYNDINYFISTNAGKEIEFTFARKNKTFKKTLKPEQVKGYDNVMFGFGPRIDKPTFLNVITSSYSQSKFVVKLVFYSFSHIFSGDASISDFSGPVGIVNEIGNAAKEGMDEGFLQSLLNVMSLAALISINLGVVNLLPLPALDGGRIVFVIIEAITGRPVNREKEGIFHFIGFLLLIALMLFITFYDIQKLIP